MFEQDLLEELGDTRKRRPASDRQIVPPPLSDEEIEQLTRDAQSRGARDDGDALD